MRSLPRNVGRVSYKVFLQDLIPWTATRLLSNSSETARRPQASAALTLSGPKRASETYKTVRPDRQQLKGKISHSTGRPAGCWQGSADPPSRPAERAPATSSRAGPAAPPGAQATPPRSRRVDPASRRGPDAALPQTAEPAAVAPAAGPASRQPEFYTNPRASRPAPAEFRAAVAATRGSWWRAGQGLWGRGCPSDLRAGSGPPSEQGRLQTPA